MKSSILALVSAGLCASPLGSQATMLSEMPRDSGSAWLAKCDGELATAFSDDFVGPGVVGNLVRPPMYRDGARKRESGDAGAEACASAMQVERNILYKSYLGLVRTVHLIEAQKYDAALQATRSIRTDAGALGDDKGFIRTIGSSALYLEAEVLVRMGKVEAAEDAALKSALMAGMDPVASSRTILFARLTPRLTEDKRRYIEQLARFNSAFLDDIAEIQAWAGDFGGASASIAADEEVMTMAGQGNPAAFGAIAATYAILAGDSVRASTEAERANRLLSQAGNAISPGDRTSIERMLDFVAVCSALAAGKKDEAEALLARRTDWISDSTTYYSAPDFLELRPPAVIAMLRQFASTEMSLPKNLDGSALSLGPEGLMKETFRTRVAYIASSSRVSEILPSIQLWSTDEAYRRIAGLVWQVNGPSHFLRQGRQGEFISTLPTVTGASAGAALLLHAALVARSRNKRGFVLSPWRDIQASSVRFGNPGEPGFPAQATLVADDVMKCYGLFFLCRWGRKVPDNITKELFDCGWGYG